MRRLCLVLLVLPSCTSGAGPDEGSLRAVEPFLNRPFVGDYPVTSVFDHDLPLSWDDSNGTVVSWRGSRLNALDGHQGYDWVMPEGTPLLAAAPGIVTRAGLGSESYCPPLGNSTRNRVLVIRHVTRSGAAFVILYSHVSRVDVDIGNVVSVGQQVALSGNTGCSTGPHLHFEVQYQSRTSAPSAAGALPVVAERGVPFDPFGWEGTGPDPWAQSPLGTASQWLWLEGAAPAGTP